MRFFVTPCAECHSQAAALLEPQQMDLAGPEFQSVLDMSSLLKLNTAGDHLKDDREGNLLRSLFFFSETLQLWDSFTMLALINLF